ncbi:MAG: TIGR01777 family protein [Candidatus Rokubacteria bacterium 13_1_40CM_4_69_39]|nr:MAG: TIGR01777 family protein [Candidatus Rokubacteria bacterium 13_1_40CM_4_69_39]OLC97088.1 MAG: TIGR01777 family protein [Candidatus Rokubacteria bacterium 13_1_40CM_3_69_38]
MTGTARAWTVAVTGASGLVGSALVTGLTSAGHRVVRVVRGAGAASVAGQRLARWDPESGALEPSALAGADAVVHLAGESVAGGRWTEAKKRRIRSTRVDVTRRLAEALPRLERPPRLLVSASAVGYYGDRGSEILREDSSPGPGFLAEVCREWEAATDPAARAGIRVVRLRIGMVLSRRGGALGAMLTPFRLGAGGPVGSGVQWVSWIAIDDLVGAILHALATESLAGPVNAVAPEPVTNRELARTLGRVLRRPALLPLPAVAARLLFGQMADELLLASARVEPARLRATGFTFRHARLEDALRHELGRPHRTRPT